MIVYAWIVIGMQALGLIFLLAAGEAQEGLEHFFTVALWAPFVGRILGWW